MTASVSVGRRSNTIHARTEVDVPGPRRLVRRHRDRAGEALSMTAYVVTCLARAVSEQPELNALRRGRKLLLLDDITINTLVERHIRGEKVPEPWPARAAQEKSYRGIHEGIRAAHRHDSDRLGTLSGSPWCLRLLPEQLARIFVRLAVRSTTMAKRYGVPSVTAMGMFGGGATRAIPLTSATIILTVGGIVRRPVIQVDGRRTANTCA